MLRQKTCCYCRAYGESYLSHNNACGKSLLLFIFAWSFRHHTVTRGITKGVKEDFRLAMERQVSRCGENLLSVLHRFCINEKIIIIQSLP